MGVEVQPVWLGMKILIALQNSRVNSGSREKHYTICVLPRCDVWILLFSATRETLFLNLRQI